MKLQVDRGIPLKVAFAKQSFMASQIAQVRSIIQFPVLFLPPLPLSLDVFLFVSLKCRHFHIFMKHAGCDIVFVVL